MLRIHWDHFKIQYRCEGHFGVQTTKIQVSEWPAWPSDLQLARLRVINNSFKPQKANLPCWLRWAVISQSHSSSVMLGMGSWTKQGIPQWASGHTSDFCSRGPDTGSWSRRLIDGCSICGDVSTVLALQERSEHEGEAVDLLTDRRSSRAVRSDQPK